MIHARLDYNHIQDPTGKIPEGEPVFLLRAQDQTAASVVRDWVRRNKQIAGHDEHAVALAEAHARLMDQWPNKKIADVPKGIDEEEPEPAAPAA